MKATGAMQRMNFSVLPAPWLLALLACLAIALPLCGAEKPKAAKVKVKRTPTELAIEKAADRAFELLDGNEDGLLEKSEMVDAPQVVHSSLEHLKKDKIIGGSKELGVSRPVEPFDTIQDVSPTQFRGIFELHAINEDVRLRAVGAVRLTACKIIGQEPLRVGTVLTIDCGLENASGRELTVPVKKFGGGREHNVAGIYQFWIERLGDNAEIPAEEFARRPRNGNRYPAGGSIIDTPSRLPPAFVTKFNIATRLETKDLPPGTYRFDVDLADRDGNHLETQSAKFKLAQ